jgi:hypothetical protein
MDTDSMHIEGVANDYVTSIAEALQNMGTAPTKLQFLDIGCVSCLAELFEDTISMSIELQ